MHMQSLQPQKTQLPATQQAAASYLPPSRLLKYIPTLGQLSGDPGQALIEFVQVIAVIALTAIAAGIFFATAYFTESLFIATATVSTLALGLFTYMQCSSPQSS